MDWLVAASAGLISGVALVIGALVAWLITVPSRVVATVMAFGSGVLLSALSFDLIADAADVGGFWPTMFGFLGGAVFYVGLNLVLDRINARNRPGTGEAPGTGIGIALGALLDGIPETAVLGLGLVGGGELSMPILLAIIISNLPEGLSSTAYLKPHRGAAYVFGLWGGITLACALSALGGFVLMQDAAPELTAGVTAVAAGAILAMICDTMIPEAFRDAKWLTGLIAVFGFFTAFGVHQMGS